MSGKPEFTIELPVQPKDVFRLLALRSIVDTDILVYKLFNEFYKIFNGIKTTSRLSRKVVFKYTHLPKTVKKEVPNMTERELCSAKTAFFCESNFTAIGKVLDYEMPLDDERNSAFGKVDLVSQINSELLLLEVKKFKSDEHPLRAMFEIVTFWKMLSDCEMLDNIRPESFKTFIDAYVKSPTYNQRKGNLPHLERVSPGLLLHKSSKIFRKLSSVNTTDDAEHELCELYKCFLQHPVGMRIFRYEYSVKDSKLMVKEATGDIKKNLGLN